MAEEPAFVMASATWMRAFRHFIISPWRERAVAGGCAQRCRGTRAWCDGWGRIVCVVTLHELKPFLTTAAAENTVCNPSEFQPEGAAAMTRILILPGNIFPRTSGRRLHLVGKSLSILILVVDWGESRTPFPMSAGVRRVSPILENSEHLDLFRLTCTPEYVPG